MELLTSDVVDLHDCLLELGSESFFKTDTHLTFEGKVVTTKEILSHFFDKNFLTEQDVDFRLSSLKGSERLMLGDLGSKLEPRVQEKRYDINATNLKRFSNQVGANDGLAVVVFNKEKIKTLPKKESPRLLIFGDSFAERTLPLLGQVYQEILFCRSRYFHEEIIDIFKPDHVITESAERYFSSVRSDLMCPRFNLVYGLKGNRHSEDKEFYKAFNAVLNFGRPSYIQYMNRFKKNIK